MWRQVQKGRHAFLRRRLDTTLRSHSASKVGNFFSFPLHPLAKNISKKTFSSRVIGHTSMVRTRLPVTTRLRKLLIIERQIRESEGKTQGAIASEAKRLKFSRDQKLEFDVEKLPDKVANCRDVTKILDAGDWDFDKRPDIQARLSRLGISIK